MDKQTLSQLKRRLLQPHGGAYFLAKAAGVQKTKKTVFDCTGGLGRDSFSLAMCGCTVITCERQANIYTKIMETHAALVKEGSRFDSALKRMRIIYGDAKEILLWLPTQPDVILLDPLVPYEYRSAKRKKEMEWIHSQASATQNETMELFTLAMTHAKERVIVKRPFKIPPLDLKITHSWKSKNTRWDMYLKSGKNPVNQTVHRTHT